MKAQTAGALVLAGGKGTRMYSDLPKVLQRVLEEPLLYYVYSALEPLFGESIWTIVGHGAEAVKQAFPKQAAKAVLQAEQLGTGHAASVAWPALEQAGLEYVLVINGDTPQIDTATLASFCEACSMPSPSGNHAGQSATLGFMTLTLDDPQSFGRVVRKDGAIQAIIEAKDYMPDVHGHDPHEVNAGIYWLHIATVGELLPLLSNVNKSGEFYITDLIGLAVERGLDVRGVSCGGNAMLMGVNTPAELVAGEEAIRAGIVADWQSKGAIIRQPQSVRISPRTTIEKGVEITGPCEIYGASSIASGTRIASHCKIVDSIIGEKVRIESFSYLLESTVGASAVVGPYARLRPEAVIEERAHIGNFVEIKKSTIHSGAKVNHLTYIGDADVGEKANIGAGTITCNYDGVNKHRTIIGKGSFIGSNASLVAPVTIGENALVGAGSVITKPVPENSMGIARGKQANLPRKK